ncbi:MAG: competence/damage-inducible protein A [Alphaproteobacteria bacterium GM7ARS4]|nr:competence/damage-inducible protein A [Alphaproteobacteria bacterium GM7ARS4]
MEQEHRVKEEGQDKAQHVTAALVIIGNEILSGRTSDKNIAFIATMLDDYGILLREVRVIADDERAIIQHINSLRFVYDYVITTGGIGPTHDDRTSCAVAKAFLVPLCCHEEALARLKKHYGEALNDARKKMAFIPRGGVLIDNPISHAPGYHIGNVMVLAGVPEIMQAMLKGAMMRLRRGKPLCSLSLLCRRAEGDIAEALAHVQSLYEDIDIGSYPWFSSKGLGVNIVLRGDDAVRVRHASDKIKGALEAVGIDIQMV